MAESEYRVESSTNEDDVKQVLRLLRQLAAYTRHRATVKKVIKRNTIIEVDVPTANLIDARCYVTWAAGDIYEVDARILVSVLDGGVCFTLPVELPRGPGKTKVVQAIDDSDPATLDLDYVRFKQSELNPFVDESGESND